VAAGTAPKAGAEGGGGGGAGAQGAPIGFSESVIENFVRETLTNAITQFAQQGELKSIVYVQPAVQGEEMRMVGIEAAFASPSAHGECVNYLRTFVADNKALAVIVIAEKKNIAFPQVWQERSKAQWQWGEGEQGIFMQLDAVAPGATHKTTERKLWFIPTGAGKQGTPREPVPPRALVATLSSLLTHAGRAGPLPALPPLSLKISGAPCRASERVCK
jgi:hypothetical protein